VLIFKQGKLDNLFFATKGLVGIWMDGWMDGLHIGMLEKTFLSSFY
jgi:hypothetical protein